MLLGGECRGHGIIKAPEMNMIRRIRPWTIVFLTAAILAVRTSGQVKGRELTHDVTVNAVTLAVTVQDRSGRYVGDLTQRDFSINENDKTMAITYFQHSFEAPLSLTVLLDVSGSMALLDRLRECREALRLLAADLLSPRDEISLLLFADGEVEVAVPFSTDKSTFLKVLDEAEAYGQTALNDAVAVSPEFADKGRNEKRALLLLTDGVENDSLISPDRALEIARRLDVPIFTIGYKIPLSERILRKYKRSKDLTGTGIIETLNKFSEATGGRTFFPTASGELQTAVRAIHKEFGHQYILGYTSYQDSLDEYRKITVVTSNKKYRVRTRKGY
jgi:Ca-activated chloride channel family protein